MKKALQIAMALMFLISQPCYANSEVSGPWDMARASENVENLALRICLKFTEDGNTVAAGVHEILVHHVIHYEGIAVPSVEQMTNFLNRNSQYMRCASGNHYMKEAFDHGRAYDQLFNVLFFEELLSDDESLWVDINGISLNTDTGEPETVLDYMYLHVADTSRPIGIRNEIQSLIETFEQYLDGKRFNQLPKDVQKAWLEYAKAQRKN